MPTVEFNQSLALRSVAEVGERLVALLTSAADPSVPVPATPQWTVAEAFAHVVTVVPRYEQGPRQEGEWVDPTRLADLNARQLAGLPDRDVRPLADRLRAELTALEATISGFGTDQPVFRFHGGQPVRADVALGILLGELVVHGHDIAAAVGRPWPIDPAHVELVMTGLEPILPGWLDRERARGHTARYEIRLRGQGVHHFAFDDGNLSTTPGAGRPDVIVSADPSTCLLLVYRRIGLWPAILAGRLVAWGRRPWLALSFIDRFHRP